jgi:hypothetical protein
MDSAREASEQQSKAALDASIDASRHEYRPWIILKAVGLAFDPLMALMTTKEAPAIVTLEPNRAMRGRVAMNNIGRSQARQVSARLKLAYSETNSPAEVTRAAEQVFQQAISRPLTPGGIDTLGPTDIRVAYSFEATSVTAMQIRATNAGIGELILAGQIDYIDADGMPHKTEVCAIFTGTSMEGFISCGIRTDMD